MNDIQANSFTIFDGHRHLATGELSTIALVAKRAIEGGAVGPVLIFDDGTGRSFDVNIRGSDTEVLARLSGVAAHEITASNLPTTGFTSDISESINGAGAVDGHRGRGRPKLGVVPREVTLLPRHWEWLSTQPGGASVTLRKLVEEARRTHADRDRIRRSHERAYEFMSAMAGDFPGFEEGIRALFANDRAKFSELIAAWPVDVRDHATYLAFGDAVKNPPSSR